MERFESVENEHGPLTKNYRRIQDLNDRDIFLRISPLGSGSSKLYPSLLLILGAFWLL